MKQLSESEIKQWEGILKLVDNFSKKDIPFLRMEETGFLVDVMKKPMQDLHDLRMKDLGISSNG